MSKTKIAAGKLAAFEELAQGLRRVKFWERWRIFDLVASAQPSYGRARAYAAEVKDAQAAAMLEGLDAVYDMIREMAEKGEIEVTEDGEAGMDTAAQA